MFKAIDRNRSLIIGIAITLSLLAVMKKVHNESIQKLTKTKDTEIQTLTQTYESKIKSYQEQLASVQQNNIVKTETITKPSGETVVIKYVDKTLKTIIQNKETAMSEEKTEDFNSVVKVEDKSEWYKKDISDSLPNFMIGLSGLQLSQQSFFTSNYSIVSGLRLLLLPIFVTMTIPIETNFYKKTSFGVMIEF